MKGVSNNLAADGPTRGPKLRADLIHQTIDMGRDPMVVCKDPLSRAYHHFTQSEHELLCLADGHRSTQEIADELKQRYPSSLIQVEAVQQFFQQAGHQGLLDSQIESKRAAPKKSRNWLSLLAIRFPGVNPTRLLEILSPLASVLFSRPVAIASLIATPICMMAVLIQFDRFASDFASITQNPLGSLVWIVFGIAIAKILHELGHALACRYLGCECPAIGVMLLFGIPCLYADVSDAWMLKRPGQRMLISAAGMYVECWIAILATIVWMTSNPGPVHDLAVTLMVVCSVSTILINGNPLLRYDGYYLLSDFTGVANLASRSRASLAAWVQTVLGKPIATAEPIWMSVYSLASVIYRCAVLLSVTAIIFQALQFYDLDLIGILLFATALTVALLKNASALQQTHTARLILAASILIAAMLFPIPHSVVAPMMVAPASSQEIYAIEPGFLVKKPEFGKQLELSDIVSALSNPALQRQHAAASAIRDRIQTQLHAFQRSRGGQSRSENMIPSLQKDLEQAGAMVLLHRQSLDRLNITSSKSCTLYPPTNIAHLSVSSSIESENEPGSWLAKGTSIGMLGDDHRREAVLYLSDRQVPEIQLGQNVSLMISDAAKGSVCGRIVTIDTSPCKQFPPSLLETGLLSMSRESIYRVRVQLDASGDDLIVHRIGRAKINATSESIIRRIYRLLSETFG